MNLPRLNQTSEDNYTGWNNNFTMQREYGFTPNGNPIGGRWVLRNAGEWVDVDQNRHDLANRNGLVLG